MTPERRALGLLGPLYHSGLESEPWQIFLKALSKELGGSAIAITAEDQSWQEPQEMYWFGLEMGMAKLYRKHVERGLPWGKNSNPGFRDRFMHTSQLISSEQLRDTAFYREWMQPQGLA